MTVASRTVIFAAIMDNTKDYGSPRARAIRTDNGVPFSHPNALFGPSKLSMWWLARPHSNSLDIYRIPGLYL